MSEHGFFHPSRGYWQTIGTPSPETIASYPAGTVQVPLKPIREGYEYHWDPAAEEWVESAIPAPEPEPPVYSTVELIAAMTPAEFDIWEQASEQFPAQHRKLFDKAATLVTGDPRFTDLIAGMITAMTDAYGAARTQELLQSAEV